MNGRRLVEDAALAAVLAAAGTAEVWVPLSSRQGDGSRAYSTVAIVALGLVLVARRRYPLPAAATVLLGWPLFMATGSGFVLFYGQFVTMGVALFSVARHGRGRAPLVGAALAAATLLAGDLLVPELRAPGEKVFHWGVFALVWAAGAGLRRHESRARVGFQRAVDAEVASAERAMRAVLQERTRIARDLHDIVAHSVSVMVVQAGAAEQMVHDDPSYVAEALATIRSTGAGALAEMRRTVTMMREPGADLEPQPGLRLGLPDLVAHARATGLEVTLDVEGPERELPAGLDLAAYRIVQEALSNVRRHAAATRASVLLTYAADQVRIEVSDDGVGAAELEPGHGLVGMRERATIYGGHVETLSDGGFTVRALLPVTPA